MLPAYIIAKPNSAICKVSTLRVLTYKNYYSYPTGSFEPIAGAKTKEKAEALLSHIHEIGEQAYFVEISHSIQNQV